MKPQAIALSEDEKKPLLLFVALSLGVTSIAALVLVGFFTALFLDSGSLLNTRIVRLKFDTGVWREVENAFHGLSATKKKKKKG